MTCILPQKLQKGDKIGIVTPASPPYGAKRKYFEKGVIYLQQKGFEVVQGRNVHAERGYLAGTDEQRAADISRMFGDPAVRAIFCTRGGYGTPRLLDLIDYETIQKNPKVFAGYSDITALELAILRQTGLVTFSGPMVAVEMGKGMDEFTEQSFWRTITDNRPIGEVLMPTGHELKIYNSGRAEGRLIGGCLSLITPLVGTKYQPNFDDAILIIEDIGEEIYRLDRHLAQLKLAGILNRLAGIVLGQFLEWEPKDENPDPFLTLEEVFADYFSDLNIPIVGNFPYGHGDVKITVPIGTRAILDADESKLILLDSVVI